MSRRPMTPDEHRARAEEIAFEVNEVIDSIVDMERPVADAQWRIVDAQLRIVRLHLDLAKEGPGAFPPPELPSRPSHVPTNQEVDYPYNDGR